MPNQQDVILQVEKALSAIQDPLILDLIRHLLVEPYAILSDWDYGTPDQKHECWTVLEHHPSNTGIAYCEEGFGPTYPWGLVFIGGPYRARMGMDLAWYASLEDAVLESRAWDGE